MRAGLLALAVVIGVSGCAGRTAKPVSVVQAYDEGLSCSQLTAEILTNEERAKQLVAERSSARGRNIAVGVVGTLLFWPALFALDLSDAERVETEAIRSRNQHLASLKAGQDCSAPSNGTGRPVQATVVQPSVQAPAVAAAPLPPQAVTLPPEPAREPIAAAPAAPPYTPPVTTYVPPSLPALPQAPAAGQGGDPGFEVHTFEE